jgi:ABC-type lipoprotein release transport system permease subunit
VAAAPYIEEQAMMVAGGKTSGVLVRGVVPEEEEKVSAIAQRVTAGSFERLEAGGFGVVLGSELAAALGAGVGDRVVLVIAQGSVTPAGVVPRMRRFEVVGIFSAGMYEYDRNLAYLHMADTARLYRMGDGVSGLRLSLADLFAAPQRRACARAGNGRRLLHQRLDAAARQLLPLHPDHEVGDVRDPAAGRRGGGVQHRVDAGDGREGQARRHRDPPDHGRRAAAAS